MEFQSSYLIPDFINSHSTPKPFDHIDHLGYPCCRCFRSGSAEAGGSIQWRIRKSHAVRIYRRDA
ncbi:hypothetical protein T4E_3750 [Trichinella pseudospiralis]|uniref:Uncharacterized protein n=1 Tax=Trichinella pseudospiralis TaxID=6337 RepID=A0A0V0XQH1_TRIPS|nr:hypothetical protein T4E_3750 [Trichinella pseudospiralis]KRY82412.1 hypothetical protein T4D_9757 [Trichinella pseudospiralis]